MKIVNPISKRIWEDRYQHNNETVGRTFGRVAGAVGSNPLECDEFARVMIEGLFFPAGRVMAGAGLGRQQTYNNCFVLGSVPDSMDGIFETAKIGALTQKAGGGTGYDFSLLRPKGTPTSNKAVASGPVSFMSVFNQATATIMAHNRRGANMGVISIYHPDIFDYITAKSKDRQTLQYFNISVMVDDAFMRAVENDEEIELHYPVYNECSEIERDESKWTHRKPVRARELWDEVVKQAYNTGEPGVLFYDTMNRLNNTNYCEQIVANNPCGEFLSGTVYADGEVKSWRGACNLGSLMLPSFVEISDEGPHINWPLLEKTIDIAIRMLDAVIDKNYYPHADYKAYQKNMRTIGLGITGLADMLALCGIRYGSEEAVSFTQVLMDTIARCAYHASIKLAIAKEPFPMCDKEMFASSNFILHQQSREDDLVRAAKTTKILYDFYQQAEQDLLSWTEISKLIGEAGIRNARLLSVAPTGTMSLTFGNNCSSGLEPVYMLEQKRYIKFGGQDEENKQEVSLNNPVWDKWNAHPEKYPWITRDTFVTALELPVDQHVAMLAAVAESVDMSCSKTINIPEDYSFEDTKEVYMTCWRSQCIKGCTIFRPNSLREGIFVTDGKKDEPAPDSQAAASLAALPRGAVVQVDDNVIGRERHLTTGCGTLHFQAYFDPDTGDLVETYASRGSQGGCNSYMVALSRMTSLAARAGTPIDAIVDQLLSAPPCIAYNNRCRDKCDTSKGMCCAAAMGHALKDMAQEIQSAIEVEEESTGEDTEAELVIKTPAGNVDSGLRAVCPDCGDELTFEGGCNVCKSCGWSKCG